MELKKDTTENSGFAYEDEARPNPNDSLFGKAGDNASLDISDNYTDSFNEPAKRSGPPKWLWIIIAVAVVAIGIFAIKLLKGSSVDGAFIMTKSVVNGEEYTVEQLEAASGMSFYVRLEIDGKEGYLVMNYAGMVGDGKVEIDVDGSNINVRNGEETLVFKYDKAQDIMRYGNGNAEIILERLQ